MSNPIGRSLAWLTAALQLESGALPAELSTAAVVPVLDVVQRGLAYGQIVEKTTIIDNPLTVGNGVLIEPDLSAQFLLVALQMAPVVGGPVRCALTLGGSGGANPPTWRVGTIVLDTGPSDTMRGLNDFTSPPRWVPAGFGLVFSSSELGVGETVALRMVALRIPAGFDLAPRGA